MTRCVVNIGYLPLVDAAPLVIAHELGFAAEEGLVLNLLRQPSWSTLRDLLAVGQLDAAHMLSPLPIAMTLGLSSIQVTVDALMVLSVNGNVIGVSRPVADAMRAAGWEGRFDTPYETGRALAAAIGSPRVGVPFPHSMHFELLDYWFNSLGLSSAQMVTIPPPMMAQAVAAGEVDAFCVGEPWGSITVDKEAGELILPGSAIWNFAPEKVLGARRDWVEAHLAEARAVIRSVWRAGEWLARPANRALASEVLSRTNFLDLPEQVIDRALVGELYPRTGAAAERVPGFLRFHGDRATYPWPSQAAWIASRMATRHELNPETTTALARTAYRADIYREALSDQEPDRAKDSRNPVGNSQIQAGGSDMIPDPNGFFDGQEFNIDPV